MLHKSPVSQRENSQFWVDLSEWERSRWVELRRDVHRGSEHLCDRVSGGCSSDWGSGSWDHCRYWLEPDSRSMHCQVRRRFAAWGVADLHDLCRMGRGGSPVRDCCKLLKATIGWRLAVSPVEKEEEDSKKKWRLCRTWRCMTSSFESNNKLRAEFDNF